MHISFLPNLPLLCNFIHLHLSIAYNEVWDKTAEVKASEVEEREVEEGGVEESEIDMGDVEDSEEEGSDHFEERK